MRTIRIREQGLVTGEPIDQVTKLTLCNGTVNSSVITTQTSWNGSLKETTDTVTQDWIKVMRRKGVINNFFKTVESQFSSGVGGHDVFTRIASCTGTTVKIYDYSSWLPALPVIDRGAHDAQLSALKKLKATEAMAGVSSPDIQGLVEMAEFNKTLRMVPQLVNNSLKLLRNLKSAKNYRRWRKSRKDLTHKGGPQDEASLLLDYLTSNYLLARYGVTPLLSTLEDLAGIASTGIDPNHIMSSRAQGTTDLFVENWDTDVVTGYSTVHNTYHTSIESKVRSGFLYKQYVDFDTYGTGITQVPSAAWELLPGSFISDWLVNVGDYIAAITPKPGVRILAPWVTIETKETRSVSYNTTSSPPSTLSHSGSRSGYNSHTVRTVTREPHSYVGLVSKVPLLTGRTYDLIHAADALALFNGSLKKG